MIKEAINERELLTNAEAGDTIAMLQLGNYLLSQNKTADAITWWEKSAEGGRAGAVYNLARHYSGIESGVGDGAKMAQWLNRLAYTHGDGWGMLQLGILMCSGTHQIWKKTIAPEDFGVARNVEEGLRLIIQGVKQAEATTKDLTLYDYDAAAEVVRAYSGPLGVEVLKLALAYKTKARGMIPPGYTAMSEAAGDIINQLQSEISQVPAPKLVPARVEVRTLSGEAPRAPTRVMVAPVPRNRTVPRHVPPPNDAARRDPRAGFGLGLQVTIAVFFLIAMTAILLLGMVEFERETFEDIVRLRVFLYGLLAAATLVIGAVSVAFRWGALGSGKIIFTLVVIAGLYSALINTINEQLTVNMNRDLWEVALSATGTAVMTGVLVGILMWITVRIYDHAKLTKLGKFALYVLLAAAVCGAMFYVLWQVDSLLVEILVSPFRSVPFVWAALLPGVLVLRWAEDI